MKLLIFSPHSRLLKLLVLLLIAVTAFSCSSSKKAFKKAQEYENAGLYVKAAEADLKALREDRNFKDALVHLKKVAPKAYKELLKRATVLESAENWDQAVVEYEHLDDLLQRFHRHGVVFKTVNVPEKLSAARLKAAEHHFSTAEAFFGKEQWQDAATAYLKAHRYVDDYNQSLQKAIRSFLNAGDDFLERKKYNRALDAYENILDIAPSHEIALQKVAGVHYALGRNLYAEERFRAALQEFETVQEYVPGFRDVRDWLDRSYEQAVQFTAVFPFLNQSRVPVNGYVIASEILSRVQNRDLAFVEFLSYPRTVALIDEFQLNRGNRLVEAELLNVAEQEALDSFVWGKVKDVDVRDELPELVEYEHELSDAGDDTTAAPEVIYFREYTAVRHVDVEMELLIIEVETGRILERQHFREGLKDVARWVAYDGSIYDLPKEKRPLLDAPRNPRPVEVILTEMVEKISNRMSRKVVDFYR